MQGAGGGSEDKAIAASLGVLESRQGGWASFGVQLKRSSQDAAVQG